VIGGTDVSKSPPLESIQVGLIPLLKQIGVHLKINDVKRGYFPIGKGHLDI
jgi:RNA 3'-terminal phosphate cyclase